MALRMMIPITITTKKSMDKTIEITVFTIHEKILSSKIIQSFKAVLQAPI